MTDAGDDARLPASSFGSESPAGAPSFLEHVAKGDVEQRAWENGMERLVIVVVLFTFGLAMPAIAEATNAPVTSSEAKSDAVTLNETQKQAVIDAAISAQSQQKTPKEFSSSIGAKVPKEVYLHGFKPSVTQETPLLKEYSYAYLDRMVVLVGPERKVAAVIALPEKFVNGEQPPQGAAEASSTNAKGNVGSVPSHTSPETIK